MKTAKQIVADIKNLLIGSNLNELINGKIYYEGHRPAGSQKEDIIIIFTTGVPSQFHRGVVAINIYVPDIENRGGYAENGRRCEELEIAASQWASSLTSKSEYLFELQQTIYTEAEAEIHQHFVVVKLKYNLFEN